MSCDWRSEGLASKEQIGRLVLKDKSGEPKAGGKGSGGVKNRVYRATKPQKSPVDLKSCSLF